MIAEPAETDTIRVHSYGHVLRVFEVEMLCHLKDWPALKNTVGVRCMVPLHNLVDDIRHPFYIGSCAVRFIKCDDF